MWIVDYIRAARDLQLLLYDNTNIEINPETHISALEMVNGSYSSENSYSSTEYEEDETTTTRRSLFNRYDDDETTTRFRDYTFNFPYNRDDEETTEEETDNYWNGDDSEEEETTTGNYYEEETEY